MRTTVDIEESMLVLAKQRALAERKSVSAVVRDALAAYFSSRQPPEPDEEFELLVRGTSDGRFPSPADLSAAEAQEDADALGLDGDSGRAAS